MSVKKIIGSGLALAIASYGSCTDEQKAQMIKLNLSQSVIEQSCNDINKNQPQISKDENADTKPTATHPYGNDKNIYIGIGISKGSGTQTREYQQTYYSQGGTSETNYDTTSTPIKIGYIFESKNRFEMSLESIDAKYSSGKTFNMNTNDKMKSTYKGMNFDWLFTFRNSELFQPYILVGFGVFGNDDIDGYNINTGQNDTAKAFAFNLGGGFTYGLSDSFELEAAYKAKGMSWNLENPDMRESLSALYFGMNYKF